MQTGNLRLTPGVSRESLLIAESRDGRGRLDRLLEVCPE